MKEPPRIEPLKMNFASLDDRELAAVASHAATLLAARLLNKTEDRLLTTVEAAPLLGLEEKKLRLTWMRYPFARKLSRTDIRFSAVKLQEWLAQGGNGTPPRHRRF